MEKIIVFGGNGGLGSKLIHLLKKKYEVISPTSKEVDITDLPSLINFFETNKPRIILNMAAKKNDEFLSKINTHNYDKIQEMIDVNIKGNINLLAASLPHMINQNYGRFISISSIFSEMNVPKNSIYCSSKAFVDRLISNANRENIKYGITCNTIQLGYWDGGMCERIELQYQDLAKNKIGLKRWGSIEELYNTINYIVDTPYLCGTKIKLDGGL
jgi:NAD(P)-dependent dehydrogenase (short-subunit alcohol dehydrogenase family)